MTSSLKSSQGVLLSLGIIGFLIYLNSLSGDFLFDDYPFVINNPAVKSGSLVEIWRAFNARFVLGISYAANYWLNKENPFGYHVVNVVVHVWNAALVFFLTATLLATPRIRNTLSLSRQREVASFAALIFLCHPLQTAAVSYITQRASSLATMFYLLTLLAYLKFRVTRQPRFYFGAFFCMVLGFLTKQFTVTIPLAILLCEVFFLRTTEKKRDLVRTLLPFGMALAMPFCLRLWEPTGSAYQYGQLVQLKQFDVQYLYTELNVLRTYLRLFVFPVNLNFDYDYPISPDFVTVPTFLSAALLLVVAGMARYFYPRDRLISFCLVWFFLTTSIEVLGVVFGNRGVIYEHWLYLPMTGFAMLAAYGLSRVLKNSAIFKWIVVGVVVVLSALTVNRNAVLSDERVLWQDVLTKSPEKPDGYFALGNMDLRAGNDSRALAYFQKAAQLYQQRSAWERVDRVYLSRIYNNMGFVFLERGQDEWALSYYKRAMSVNPDNAEAANNLGVWYFENKDYSGALKFLRQSLALQGDYAQGRTYLGQAYLALGDKDLARENLEKARRLWLREKNSARAQETELLLREIENARMK